MGQSLAATGRLPAASPIWWRLLAASAVLICSTVAWGAITSHGLGGSESLARITPFNDSWRGTIVIVTVSAGLLLTIPIAGILARRSNRLLFDACAATSVVVIVGALLWGLLLASFNSFYFFFGAIAVFATPVAAVAVWWLVQRFWAAQRRGLALGLAAFCLIQLEFGVLMGLSRLPKQDSLYDPTPLGVFEAIQRLPPDAKLAYACQSFEEISFVNSKLLSIDAHTARRIVPICFEADVNGPLLGAEVSDKVPDAGFLSAPQARLYPDSTARPSSEAVSVFLKSHGIDYLYVDAMHPNSLVPDALPVAAIDDHRVLRIP